MQSLLHLDNSTRTSKARVSHQVKVDLTSCLASLRYGPHHQWLAPSAVWGQTNQWIRTSFFHEGRKFEFRSSCPKAGLLEFPAWRDRMQAQIKLLQLQWNEALRTIKATSSGPLDSDRQENIRATSSGKWWTIKHLDSDGQENIRDLWTAMDKTTSELLPLDSEGQENIRDLWTAMDKTTSETSGQRWTKQHQSYLLWTAMDKTAPTKKDTDYRKAHLQQHSVWGMLECDKNKLVSFQILTSHQLLWVTSWLHGKGCHCNRFPQWTGIQYRQGCWCCSNVIRLLKSTRIKRDCRNTCLWQHSLRDAGVVPQWSDCFHQQGQKETAEIHTSNSTRVSGMLELFQAWHNCSQGQG